MFARRILSLLRARWYVVVVAAIVAGAMGFMVTQQRNRQIRNTFVATAAVQFLQLEDETDDSFERRLQGAAADAERLRIDQGLGADDRLDVSSDVRTNRLLFQATARQPALAEELAAAFRDSYLQAEPSSTVLETIRARMSSIASRIDELVEQRDAQLTGDPTVEPDPTIERQRTFLVIQQTALRGRSEDLTRQLTLAEFEDVPEEDLSAIQGELDAVNVALAEVEAEIELLPPPPAIPQPSITDTLDSQVLDTIIGNLQSEYITLSLRLLEESEIAALTDRVLVVDETPPFRSRFITGFAGLVGGAFAALVALILLDQLRRTVWTPDDMDQLEGLGPVPRRNRKYPANNLWYLASGPNRRRRDIQAIRAVLETQIAEGPTSIALSGINIAQNEVHEFAADLAASISVSGRRVLLIDADFERPTTLPEFGNSYIRLSNILSEGNGHHGNPEEISSFLMEIPEVTDKLLAMTPGRGLHDPADTLAGHRFQAVIDRAKSLTDVVIVVGPSWPHPISDVLSQRLDNITFLAKEGKTTGGQIDEAMRDMTGRKAKVLGAVLVARRRTRVHRKPLDIEPLPAAVGATVADPGASATEEEPSNVEA